MAEKSIIHAVIDRVESNIVILQTDEGGEITIAESLMPYDADEGSAVKITIQIQSQGARFLEHESVKLPDEAEEEKYVEAEEDEES